jgi:ATP-dependent helicase/nuclease subunit A
LKDAQAVGDAHAWVPQPQGAYPHVDGRDALALLEARLAVLPTLTGSLQNTVASALPPSLADAESSALGQVVHKALEWLTMVDVGQRGPDRVKLAVQAACAALSVSLELSDRAQAWVGRILGSEELRPWLDPRQVAWAGNEVGLIHDGRTLRIDRLVARDLASGREWWVLDYKINHRPQDLPSYQAQMRQYVEAVLALQAGDVVRAAFITGEGRLVEVL